MGPAKVLNLGKRFVMLLFLLHRWQVKERGAKPLRKFPRQSRDVYEVQCRVHQVVFYLEWFVFRGQQDLGAAGCKALRAGLWGMCPEALQGSKVLSIHLGPGQRRRQGSAEADAFHKCANGV